MAQTIRLGVASEFLRDHNGAKWAYEWLANLPRQDYEFYLYALHGFTDAVTEKFAELGRFRRLAAAGDDFSGAIAQIKADDLHALMLPAVGMSGLSRVLAQHRIAPLQFTGWGHPVTTGSPAMDFYLSGDLMEPDDAHNHYSETLVRLPNLGLFVRASQPQRATRDQFGLPEGRVLFGAVQALMKYLPVYDEVYPAIAGRVPAALFVFVEGDPPYTTAILRERLDAAFAHAGLRASDHVRFLPRMPQEAFARLFTVLDVNLDSIGWNGGNTTLQALAADCPTVTLPGQLMRGRHGYGIMTMAGLGEFVAASVQDFIGKAAALGARQDLRSQAIVKIKENKGKIYEDQEVIAALDRFLKLEVGRRRPGAQHGGH
jgi:predicted O-linked N-acetylglucosamine transferase (SPINDLY family)